MVRGELLKPPPIKTHLNKIIYVKTSLSNLSDDLELMIIIVHFALSCHFLACNPIIIPSVLSDEIVSFVYLHRSCSQKS